MTYYRAMLLQGLLGLSAGAFLFAFPEAVLIVMTTAYTVTAIIVLRLLAIFIVILCAVLLVIRGITDRKVQQQVLLINMVFDGGTALFVAVLTVQGHLLVPGGWLLASFMLGNALSYVPAYRAGWA